MKPWRFEVLIGGGTAIRFGPYPKVQEVKQAFVTLTTDATANTRIVILRDYLPAPALVISQFPTLEIADSIDTAAITWAQGLENQNVTTSIEPATALVTAPLPFKFYIANGHVVDILVFSPGAADVLSTAVLTLRDVDEVRMQH